MLYSSPYESFIKNLSRTLTCPYLIFETHCAGGDYCPFQPGKNHLCCFFCQHFDDCPDKSGICQRYLDR